MYIRTYPQSGLHQLDHCTNIHSTNHIHHQNGHTLVIVAFSSCSEITVSLEQNVSFEDKKSFSEVTPLHQMMITAYESSFHISVISTGEDERSHCCKVKKYLYFSQQQQQ